MLLLAQQPDHDVVTQPPIDMNVTIIHHNSAASFRDPQLTRHSLKPQTSNSPSHAVVLPSLLQVLIPKTLLKMMPSELHCELMMPCSSGRHPPEDQSGGHLQPGGQLPCRPGGSSSSSSGRECSGGSGSSGSSSSSWHSWWPGCGSRPP
jgi:uncharacterized membrane protein YgcG